MPFPAFLSNIELAWDVPNLERFLHRLGHVADLRDRRVRRPGPKREGAERQNPAKGGVFRALYRDRTDDLFLTMEALYRLS
jgi:hypothetical protein